MFPPKCIRHSMQARLVLTCCAVALAGVYFWLFDPPGIDDQCVRSARQQGAILTAEEQQVLANFRLALKQGGDFREVVGDPSLGRSLSDLVKSRREIMMRLIMQDPARALQEAVSWSEWQSLPENIRAEVEQPFSRIARYSLLPVCGETPTSTGAQAHLLRILHASGSSPVQVFLPAGSAEITSKHQLAIQGIQLDSVAAIHPEPLSILSPSDANAVSHLPIANPDSGRDFATGAILGEEPITALCGGFRLLFASVSNAAAFSRQLQEQDQVPDPGWSSASRLAAFAPNLLSQPGSPVTTSLSGASNWTTSKKKVFIIRCDFVDFPSSSFPLPDASSYASQLNGEISSVIQQFSYGKTWLEASVSAAILRSSQPASYYTSKPDATAANLELYQNLIQQYKSANPSFSEANYDIIGIRFPAIGMTIGGGVYSGLAEIGGSNLWLQGNVSTTIHVHELGHNYGLDHSNFWQRPYGSTNPVDPAGSDENYGDPFDVMGAGEAPLASFHADAKQRLSWLGSSDWTSVTTSGTYRIRRIDDASTTGSRGLRIQRATDDYYWLSYRRAPDLFHLKSGGCLTWKRPGQIKSWLVDTTPDSIPGSGDKSDASIRIGRTYSDTSTNIHITAVGRGGSSPNEYLDVHVNIGPFPGNVAPTGQIAGPSTLSTRQAAVFSVAPTDANGDQTFAYDWSFGTGDTFDNNSSVVMMWNSPGTYQVQCTVSDLKGGKTTITKSVTVAEPMASWSARTNTGVGDYYTLVNGPNKLVAAGSGTQKELANLGPIAFSTNGGTTWSAGKFSNYKHAYAGVWNGSSYVMAGLDYAFSNTGTIRRTPSGYYGAIFTASDVTFSSGLATFTTRYLGTLANSFLWGIAYGNGIHVAVGDNGAIVRSTDGINWTVINAGVTGNFTHIAYGNGLFVAVGRNDPYGTQKGFVYTSSDGLTWTNRTSGAGFNNENYKFFWQVTYAYDRFLFSGWNVGLHYSTDGITFVKARQNAWEFTPAMSYGANLWFASGVDQANGNASVDLISTDGSNWAKITTPTRPNLVNTAAFHNQTFVMAGDKHTIWQGSPVTTSPRNLYSWRETYFPDRDSLSVPLADADGDGVSNLMEYVFDTPPLSAASSLAASPLPQAARVTDNPLLIDRISLQFSIPDPAPGDLTQIVEASPSLSGPWTQVASKTGNASWIWSGGGTSRIVSSSSVNGRTSVTVGDSQPISNANGRFMRLKTTTAQ